MTQPQPAASAELRTEVALAQLLDPVREELDRDPDDIKAQLRTEDRDYLDQIGRHAITIRDAADRNDVATAERARVAITQAAQRHGHRRAAITATHAELPSLLDQLLAAVDPSSDTGGTGSASPAAHRSALGIAAFDLLRAIQRATGAPDHTHLDHALRGWTGDPATVEEWVSKARGILSPAKRWAMPGRCPNCGRGTVHVPDSTGETVRRLALELDPSTAETHCLNCGTSWPPARARQLEAVLRQQQEEDAAARRHAVRDGTR